MNSYVLITPARNEGKYIGKTLDSIVQQTVKPSRWIIISDGSTDNTDALVTGYAEKYGFIRFYRAEDNNQRNFGSKVAAFNFGLSKLDIQDYEFIGNLDGDMGFEADYYEKILNKFRENPKLGIAGGIRRDFQDGRFIEIKSSRNSVAGGLQLFRRECFEQIGGYQPLEYGGIDAVAEIMARMHKWEVESFENIIAYHYKPTGSATNNTLKQKFRTGIKYYLIGYHPVFPIVRFSMRLFLPPPIIGSIAALSGYFWAAIRRVKRPVPDSFVRYLRAEQKSRIRTFLRKGKDPVFRF